MERSKLKIKTYEIILCIIVLCIIVTGLFVPRTGPLVMVDEICDSAVIWIVCIYISARLLSGRTDIQAVRKPVRAAIAVICIVIGVWFSKNFVMDLITGSQTVTLSDVEMSGGQTHTGIFSLHYYMTGLDEQGKRIRVEISGGDQTRLSGKETVMIEYYRNTRRVVRFL